MKKVFIALLSVFLLSGCGMFDRGNYEKDRSGFVISGNLIVNYHTNSIGEIDVFMIDQLLTFFEALEYTSFDTDTLSSGDMIDSLVTTEELAACDIITELQIPRFLRIGDVTYFYNIRDNGYCTYDEYQFHKDGFTDLFIYNTNEVSPIEKLNRVRFKNADFTINTFSDILFIENIYYSLARDEWVKKIISVLPMSLIQAGDNYEDVFETVEEIGILENYVLTNQSVNLLELKENYQDEDVNNIWSDETVEYLGRDHEIIKKVRLKNTGDILEIINDTLSRLGMFQ